MELDNPEKQVKVYRNFVIKRLETLARKRPVWIEIPDKLNAVIESLGDYSYAKVSESYRG